MLKPIKIIEKIHSFSPGLAYKLLQLSNNAVRTDREFTETFWQLVREERMLLSLREAYNIYSHLNSALPLGGAIAELGVYKGGGAKLICQFKGDRPFHLFDTFEGMPAVDKAADLHEQGDFSDTALEGVQQYLRGYPECFFHKGLFPDTTQGLPDDLEFCFVHLDADLYESTLSGLKYFYPRLKKGGVIISHDFKAISCPGVKQAFDEFFAGRNGIVTHLWDTQALVRRLD